MTEPTTANRSESEELISTSNCASDKSIDSEIKMQIRPVALDVKNIQCPVLVLSGDGNDLFVIAGYR